MYGRKQLMNSILVFEFSSYAHSHASNQVLQHLNIYIIRKWARTVLFGIFLDDSKYARLNQFLHAQVPSLDVLGILPWSMPGSDGFSSG